MFGSIALSNKKLIWKIRGLRALTEQEAARTILGPLCQATKARNRVSFAELAASTGRAPDELVEDAMSGYLAELSQLRNTLDRRYDQIKSGKEFNQ